MDGVVIARLRETAVTLFYTRHKHINYGDDGVLAALPVPFVTHKAREESPISVTPLPVFKNAGFDSCVGRLMTHPATTLLTNQWPAVC